MKWPHGAAVAFVALLGLGAVFLTWLNERQLDAQRKLREAWAAQQQAEQERAQAHWAAQQQAARQRAQAQPGPVAGQPWVAPPVLPPLSPSPPVMPLLPPSPPMFLWLFPLLMGPALLLVLVQQQRSDKERRAEEEERTPYTEEELMQDWEFKIMRSQGNLFHRREELDKMLQEEAQGGWQLVEKFDDARVRLKRPTSLRAGDAALPAGYDPYRTVIKIKVSFHQVSLVVCLMVFGMCALMIPVGALAQHKDPIAPETFRTLMWSVTAGALVFGSIACWLILRARRAGKKVLP